MYVKLIRKISSIYFHNNNNNNVCMRTGYTIEHRGKNRES